MLTRPERLIDYLKNRDVDGIIDCTINIAIVRIAGYLRLYSLAKRIAIEPQLYKCYSYMERNRGVELRVAT